MGVHSNLLRGSSRHAQISSIRSAGVLKIPGSVCLRPQCSYQTGICFHVALNAGPSPGSYGGKSVGFCSPLFFGNRSRTLYSRVWLPLVCQICQDGV